jgi:hypothetical protein
LYKAIVQYTDELWDEYLLVLIGHASEGSNLGHSGTVVLTLWTLVAVVLNVYIATWNNSSEIMDIVL